MRAQPQAPHYIGGAYTASQCGPQLDSLYPATRQWSGRRHRGDAAGLEAATAPSTEGQER